MAWQHQTIERQALFDQVWAEPMTKVAKFYALSDVALRKICVTLDIPLPPRGYWIKVVKGATLNKPTLHATSVAPTYTRSKYLSHVDEEIEERFAQARHDNPPPLLADLPAYCPTRDHQSFQPETKLVVRAMKGIDVEEGVRHSSGATWADISVSDGLVERSLLLVDRFAYALRCIGAQFDNSHPPLPSLPRGMRRDTSLKRNCFVISNQLFFVRIRERITQELVPPPQPKARPGRPRLAQLRPTWEYRPPEYRYISTGKLHVGIFNANGYFECYKMEDTASATIENKVQKAVLWIENDTLRRHVRATVYAERAREQRAKIEAWEQRKANKEQLLAKLATFESMSKDLDRAESLRRLRDRILAQPGVSVELTESIEQLTLMADWLDPLVKAAWPEVDDVGDKHPDSGLW